MRIDYFQPQDTQYRLDSFGCARSFPCQELVHGVGFNTGFDDQPVFRPSAPIKFGKYCFANHVGLPRVFVAGSEQTLRVGRTNNPESAVISKDDTHRNFASVGERLRRCAIRKLDRLVSQVVFGLVVFHTTIVS